MQSGIRIQYPKIRLFTSFASFSLEMLILDNVDFNTDMKLSMSSVHWMVENCPNLTHLGNLRSWKSIDYYNIENVHFYRQESELSRFKAHALKNNWDLDLEIENLDLLYT